MKRPEQRGRTCPYHGAMIYVTRCGRAGIVVAMIGVLGWLGGCSDAPTSAPPPPPPPPPPTIAIVSDTAPAAGFASGPVEASVQQASAADEVVYVSLTPGTVPAGATATIRRVGGAASLVTTLSDGGFDPVPVEAQTNDSIEVVVRDAGGTTVADLRLVVAVRRPPVVVRTNPPHKKNDVPLNAAIIVVFSEPVDGSTLTPGSVQLLRGTSPVAGTVRLLDASGLVALFQPAQLLAPATAYRLVVGQAVRDRDGDALEAPVAIDFTTGSALTGPAASVTVYPDFVEEFFPVTMTITAYVRDASGNVLLSPTVEWASSDSSVAVVRPGLAWWQTSGREAWLTLRAGGVATITATSEGLSYTVVVRSRPVPSEPAGSLGVTTTTTGTDFDPNGYSLTVAGVSYQRLWGVPVNGSVTLPGVPVGEHSVTLNELAPNCAVIGANPQTVTITAGTTSQVAFAVTCGSGAPSLRVTISTTGGDLDTTGYRVNVLGFGFQDGAPVNGPVAFYFIPPGAYQVELQDIAANCVVSGANRQTVTVTGGATAELAFAVTCSSAANGSIRITTVTTGEDFDPNGYYAAWGASGGSWLQANGSVTVPAVPAGVEGVGLSDVASNCAIVGGEWKTVTVTAGATNDVTFAVTCAGDLPSLRVTIATTGTDVDPDGYSLDVLYLPCGWEPWQCGPNVPVNGSVTYSGITPPRDYWVQISGVAANCAVIGANPQKVSIVRGATADVAFAVTCGSGAPSLRVTTATTGGDLDVDGYRVNVLGFGFQDGAPVNGPAAFYFIPPGTYWVALQDIASNCAVNGTNPRAVTVTDGATAELAFAVTCTSAANGSIRVTTVTTGEDVDPDGYTAQLVGYGYPLYLTVNGSSAYPSVQPGGYSVELKGLAANCTVSGANPQPVTVTIGATADAVFAITCVRLQ